MKFEKIQKSWLLGAMHFGCWKRSTGVPPITFISLGPKQPDIVRNSLSLPLARERSPRSGDASEQHSL